LLHRKPSAIKPQRSYAIALGAGAGMEKDTSMVSAFLRGLTLLKERAFWRVVWHSILLTAAALIVLYIIVWAVLTYVSVADIWWIDTLVDVLGGLVVLVLTWLLFPAVATLVISLFIDRIITAVETQYYPFLPVPLSLPFWRGIAVALKFTSAMLVLNLIALPLYLVPILNVIVFYGLNAYLLGREYFELVALRRLDPPSAQRLRRAHRLRLFIAGLLIAGLLTLPVVNLVAPLLAAAFMVHLATALKTPQPPPTALDTPSA
jgi:CysZ protein